MKTIQIVSGGQTGADQAALRWAIQHQVPHGGWCPRERRSESGPIPEIYRLRETPNETYEERTMWNVRDSDATVIFTLQEGLAGGSAHTAVACVDIGKPVLHLAAATFTPREAAHALSHFLKKHHVTVLNIAGPRASEEPGVDAWVCDVMDRVFG